VCTNLESEGLVIGRGGDVDEHAGGRRVIDGKREVAPDVERRLQTAIVLHRGAHLFHYLDTVRTNIG
jgi:hypothetical protein